MRHLIIGGTGKVGSVVTASLVDDGHDVRVLTRSQEHAASLPTGAVAIMGDLEDPDTLSGAFQDVDALLLILAVSPTELQQGLVALHEAQRAGINRVVHLSVQDAERGLHIPHFASKVAIEAALRQSGIPHTILRPNNYFQNDLQMKDAILQHGVYPQPIGTGGMNGVDVRDVAAAAVNALTRIEPAGKSYTIAGPDALTGNACAAEYTSALGREIRYMGDDVEAWGAMLQGMLPAWLIYDLKLMYGEFQRGGFRASDRQHDETRSIVGAEPRRYRDFVRETVRNWT